MLYIKFYFGKRFTKSLLSVPLLVKLQGYDRVISNLIKPDFIKNCVNYFRWKASWQIFDKPLNIPEYPDKTLFKLQHSEKTKSFFLSCFALCLLIDEECLKRSMSREQIKTYSNFSQFISYKRAKNRSLKLTLYVLLLRALPFFCLMNMLQICVRIW